MSTTIVGLFDEEQSAQFLQQEIRDRGIEEHDIETLSWKGLSAGNDPWGIHKAGNSDSDINQNLAAHLRDWGVSDEDSRDFAEAVRRGGNIVLTRVDDDQKVDEITRLMDQREAIDLDDRRAMWRNEGTGDKHDRYAATGIDRDTTADVSGPRTGDRTGLQEAHEELHVGKRKVASGKVRVHKHVEEKPVEKDVTLRSETIDVERRPIDSTEKANLGGDVFQDETMEFTEYSEEPMVEKEVRLDDEYVVKRNVEEHEETIHDTVRHTVVDIEDLTGGLSAEDSFDSYEPGFRQDFNSNYGDSGKYDDYRPAYRFGHAFGASDQYNQRDYEDIEPDMRRSYEDRYGRGSFGPYSNAARHAFDSMRTRGNRSRGDRI